MSTSILNGNFATYVFRNMWTVHVLVLNAHFFGTSYDNAPFSRGSLHHLIWYMSLQFTWCCLHRVAASWLSYLDTTRHDRPGTKSSGYLPCHYALWLTSWQGHFTGLPTPHFVRKLAHMLHIMVFYSLECTIVASLRFTDTCLHFMCY
ncbi:hypothetical protein BDR04DRAFT_405002 [Suillus decipiens]|nr:hypothetical protein BDR04DRAFT_405002 [Suillus decipiens]